ncbi:MULTISPECIES: bifunctional diaminohydroxyphosphoribosylaminopyrimidine deaminase/5-amino-6-(5-phosphoribosylamino)uracil reductase RibD [unclassified Prochlorococcus]|uniref:bifunctional diaminohydroxyphosphoribosylaminopyrimidine deaminase/5-amino-6-(5-phosphoribosylamino)uracil reductase RibD n=1 Tax=unclassified Prochlorococcus TaxID=2627481 RepID=UPI000533B193|nr:MULTISPECIES: bifunctional diaminohydroxyphosphoribosylaminopyrimidine deaminase/5-amino-6-(5-phosphoribosylamino)uracil reductase RibD [unclassified Prochlorococcus]KGG16307.1 Diaminohydroxyphosphoribosylaminopyrimidine deaminase [Prochlorococcus sp. MIT 0603]KGG17959.1 Diaminohydroxyphosphoribosylaminopyrimidine deaminase [Prochlorococcus sp. MIT 0602]
MRPDLYQRTWGQWMRRVLDLALLAEGQTSPNPLVGAVILDSQQNLIGEGFHRGTGQKHAEIEALLQAGPNAKGGTLLINLEPCCHYGKTPPCTKSILKSGLARVVVAIKDPDPRVSGKGISILRKAGIEVITGVLEKEAAWLNRAFIFRNQTGRPWGVLKWAMSLDGRTALPNGTSQWISGEESRKKVHSLRSRCDAVIVGGKTVKFDNPLLTSRGIKKKEPLRVVLSSSLDFPVEAQIWNTKQAETLICYGPESNSRLLDKLPDGPESILLEECNPAKLLEVLAQKGCNQVLWECGSRLATAAIKHNCVQEILVFISPKLLGGTSAMTPLSNLGFASMEQVLTVKEISQSKKGHDFVLNMLI